MIIRKIRTALQVEDVRRLMKNFFSLSVLKLVNAVLPFVTLPYLIKVLGLQQYGAIVLALSLIAYFQSITDYGFNLSATREVAKHKKSKKQLNFIYSKTLTSKLYLLIFALVVIIPVIFLVPQFKEDLPVYLLMCLMLIGQTLFPEWFFRGVEQMGYIAGLNFVVKMIFTIGVFLLIKQPQDYWIYPLLLGLSYILISIYSYHLITKNFNIKFYLVNKSKVSNNLRRNFPLFINQFVPNLFNNTTNFLIGILLGKTAVGLFGAIRQVLQTLTVFNSVVSMVVFPYLTVNKDKFNFFRKSYLILFILLALMLIFLHKYILELIGINDSDASIVFYILLMGVLSIVIYSIYATNYLIARGFDRVVMKVTLVSSLIGFALAYPLIYYFGVVGGAINIFICQLILGLSAYYVYRKYNLDIKS